MVAVRKEQLRYVVFIVYLPHTLFYFTYEPCVFVCLQATRLDVGMSTFGP